jgi:hypothetical protein
MPAQANSSRDPILKKPETKQGKQAERLKWVKDSLARSMKKKCYLFCL